MFGESREVAHGAARRAHDGRWSLGRAVAVLLLSAGAVGWLSEILVGSTEEAIKHIGLSEVFVGLIVVPIIGNAAEHSSAVMMAMRNRMDLAVSIAVGSSAQVALLIAPVLVFVGLAMGRPMDLAFTTFEVIVGGARRGGRDVRGTRCGVGLARGRLPAAGLRNARRRLLLLSEREKAAEMAQTPVASRFDFNSREPYLAPPPRQRQRVVKISAILFAPDDAAPPPALTEWLARHADAVLRVREMDELMAISLRGRPRVVAFDARNDPKPVERPAPGSSATPTPAWSPR